jgi:hypothetical protein
MDKKISKKLLLTALELEIERVQKIRNFDRDTTIKGLQDKSTREKVDYGYYIACVNFLNLVGGLQGE